MDAIKRRASSIASTVEPSNFGRIVHIAPITKRESRSVHLVAITHAGKVFLYGLNNTLVYIILAELVYK